jgi:hypothetical protein
VREHADHGADFDAALDGFAADELAGWVWNNVKNDRISRGVIMSKDDLKARAIGALRRLQKLPGIVRGFLRDPKLSYILTY